MVKRVMTTWLLMFPMRYAQWCFFYVTVLVVGVSSVVSVHMGYKSKMTAFVSIKELQMPERIQSGHLSLECKSDL